jgi:hypothetical protein
MLQQVEMPDDASRIALIALNDQVRHPEPSHVELFDIEVTKFTAIDDQATDAKPADREKPDGDGADSESADRRCADRYGLPSRRWQDLSILYPLHPCSPGG